VQDTPSSFLRKEYRLHPGQRISDSLFVLANDNDLSSRFLSSWVGRAWKVYIIRCRTGDLYTGCTIDIGRRIEQHNRGTGSKFTSSRRPVTLVYQETCSDRSAALRRENQIKRMRRGQKIRLIQTASATKA
jgi:putative endonuclease